MIKIEVQKYGKIVETHTYDKMEMDIEFIRGIVHDVVARYINLQDDGIEDIIIHCYTE